MKKKSDCPGTFRTLLKLLSIDFKKSVHYPSLYEKTHFAVNFIFSIEFL